MSKKPLIITFIFIGFTLLLFSGCTKQNTKNSTPKIVSIQNIKNNNKSLIINHKKFNNSNKYIFNINGRIINKAGNSLLTNKSIKLISSNDGFDTLTSSSVFSSYWYASIW